jgi:glycosyltransferase involved in cell wall biosynthesis
VLGIPIAWMSRVPVRISSQRNPLIAFPNWFLRLDSWIVNSPMVDVMLTVSEQTRQFCVDSEGMKSQKLITVSNGINVNEFQQDCSIDELTDLRDKFGIPRNGYVMTIIARLHPQKGHSFLIDAASLVLEFQPDAIFLLIGDGESRNDIEDRIQYLGLTPHFRLIGLSSNIRQLLALSELFVLPSLYEGMPNVILEAMAAKLAVVATDIGGTRELVVHGETGILVPPADPKALGTAIISLLNDPVTRLSMGRRGHERVKAHFSEQVMCQRYEKLMRSVIAQKGKK